MAKKSLPDDIKEAVEARIKDFNETEIGDENFYFIPRFRGRFVYLDRREGKLVSERGRLGYTGDMKDWDFAIYKYSSNRYDPDEWFFPGAEHINGTVEGALKACIKAYP